MDALAGISCGFHAVTTTAGVSTWTDEDARALAGKSVTIIMDNDKAGESGAKVRAEALAKHGRKVALTVKWPSDRPEHHDVTDELKSYGVESFSAILASATSTSNGDPSLICLVDVEPENVEWLWYPYLSIGKLSMIEGDPNLGKSWITLAMACHVSVGKGFPGVLPCEPQNVLPMSCEDGLGDTIEPRLTGMEADTFKVFAPTEIFTFDDSGIKILQKHIARINPRLIVIDPLVAYMGGKIEMNRANETRQLMAKLADLAARSRYAILMLRHLTKASSDKAIYRGIGSIDLISTAKMCGAEWSPKWKTAGFPALPPMVI